VTLEPGTMVSTTRLVEPGESVGLRVSGPDVAAGDVTVTVRHDTGGDRELAVDAEGFTAEVENDREECRAVRFVASRAPGPGESACLELVSHRAPPAGAPAGREASLDAVVVVMTDTMRADLYSVERSQFNVPMETLSELFSRSTVFTGATAHASYTKPSVASILTGLYPEQHGALGRKAPVADEVTLLPEILEDNGVTTVAFLSNYFFDPVFGLREGWTEEHSADPYKAARDDDVVVTEFERWCAEGVPEGPLFVYIHLMGAHAPYSPPRDYRREFLGGAGLSRRIVPRHTAKLIADLIAGRQKKLDRRETAQMRRLYRADAAYHDDVMGRLLAALESSGLAERALLIYTSDHGEEFYEHGRIGHGTGLWYEQVRVPLVVREPGQADGRLVSTTAGHVDVAPTVLSTLGVEPPAPLPGRDLLSIAAEPPTSSRGLLMQSWMGRWGIQVGPFKLLRRPQDERLFVVRTAGEDEVRPDENPVLHELLRVHMAWAYHDLGAGAPGGAAADSELDPELENRLEALGYVMD
jgi:arylsulfatase A-like enzyme